MTASVRWSVWSTSAELVVTEPAALARAEQIVREHLEAVDRACSRFRPGAEIRTLEAAHGRRRFISPLLAELLRCALTAAEQTEGSVDPTLGRELVSLGYDRDFRLLEDGDGIARAVLVHPPAWTKIQLDATSAAIPEGVQLDLGATAKAVAADHGAALVAEQLGCGVLVNLGGDLATAGPAPRGGWQVTVQDTADEPGCQIGLPAGAALATSSTLKRTWRRGGRTLHHVVDPQTGRPAADTWRTVTVVARTCLQANTLSTAAIVRAAHAPHWLHQRGCPARLVGADQRVLTLCGWPAESCAA